MARSLTATNIQNTDIDLAFSLIQALYPKVTLDMWRVFASPLINQQLVARQGLIGIRNESAYLCGLFVYRIEADLEYELALVVDVVAALDIIDPKAAIGAIVETVRFMAQQQRCNIVRVRTTHTQESLKLYLANHGFSSEGLFMSQRFSTS